MKALKLLTLLLLTTICFTSCKSDDDSSSSENSEIIGTWKLKAMTVNGAAKQLDACESMYKLQFTKSSMTTTTFEGAACEDKMEVTVIYVINENIITSGTGEDAVSVEITTLTGKSMVIEGFRNNKSYIESYSK